MAGTLRNRRPDGMLEPTVSLQFLNSSLTQRHCLELRPRLRYSSPSGGDPALTKGGAKQHEPGRLFRIAIVVLVLVAVAFVVGYLLAVATLP